MRKNVTSVEIANKMMRDFYRYWELERRRQRGARLTLSERKERLSLRARIAVVRHRNLKDFIKDFIS